MFLFLYFNELYMNFDLFLIEIKVKVSRSHCLPSKKKDANIPT